MKFLTLTLFSVFSFLSFAGEVKLDVQLSPAGSFETKGAVAGQLTKSKGKLVGTFKVPVKSLKTGIELRDSHLQKRLMPEKHPNILGKVQISGSTLKGIIKAKGITQKFSGKCETGATSATCEFKLSLKSFKIEDISYMGVGVVDELGVEVTVPIK